MNNKIVLMLMGLILISNIIALDTQNENRLSFGHILIVKEISTEPLNMIPGNEGVLKVVMINNGDLPAKDIRAHLYLPAEIAFISDVSEKRVSEIKPDKQAEFNFKIIALPKTAEGVYKASLEIDYLNNIGEERQDNYSIGLIVKSVPKIFAQIEKTEIYDEKRTGELTVTFTNNDLADITFLTAEIAESEDYEIISSNKKYIGDLDSNDFQSTTFTLKIVNNIKDLTIPIKVDYKDSLNKDYSQEFKLPLKIRTGAELGIANNSYYLGLIALVLLIVLVIYLYRRNIHKRKSEY
ncbi:MAG: NEW3 domain-containing protein [Candidatus Pacearchaeota archaeon]|jgi:hypothetical protein